MRPRTFEQRRQPRRRRICDPWLLWLLIAAAAAAVLILVLVLSREKQPGPSPIVSKKHDIPIFVEGLNVTDEILSPLSTTRQLLEQITLARAVLIVSKDCNDLQFAGELSAQIRHSQALLSSAATRGAPPTIEEAKKAIRDMALLLIQARQLHHDSATMIMKLKSQMQTLEEKSRAEIERSTKYGQIAAEKLPKGLYCLGVRLTMEWFKKTDLQQLAEKRQFSQKLRDNDLHHFCVFSDNILAVSVVVNSTTMNSKNPHLIVFHLVTDEVNYAAMNTWFTMNDFRGATVEVQKFEDFSWLNASYVPVLKLLKDSETQNFYFSGSVDVKSPIKFRNPKYLSLLNHLRFYMPEVYPALEKIVFLDDDIIVQKDLSDLFRINLNGNVMGAVETCKETFHRFHKYLNFSHPYLCAHFDGNSCGWAFGMNVFDLREWRKKNVTSIYHYWQERNKDHTLWKLGSLPPGLLAFYGLVEKLESKWHVLGLGYTTVDPSVLEEGAVLHYNGNMKPWLKIGMEKYKGMWDRYVDYSHPLLQQCFVR